MCLVFVVILLLSTSFALNPWDGYHRQLDDGLPPISWEECGVSNRKCDPKTTFQDPIASSRIYVGELASTGEYPWFGYLESSFWLNDTGVPELVALGCGAAILNEWWVLTAAHCVDSSKVPNASIVLQIGSIARNAGRRHVVEKVVVHQNFGDLSKLLSPEELKLAEEEESLRKGLALLEINDTDKSVISDRSQKQQTLQPKVMGIWMKHLFTSEQYWDIALLKVKNRIILDRNESHYTINSICLPKPRIHNINNESIAILGLGSESPSMLLAAQLRKGFTKILDQRTCEKLVGHLFGTKNLCIQEMVSDNITTVCSGDSGSPSHQYSGCQAIQLGLASAFSKRHSLGVCGTRGFYTRVSLFTDWIRSVINPNAEKKESGVVAKTSSSRLLIFIVITMTIIAVVISSALLWLSLKILSKRQNV